jgi:hypothetical protein
MVKAILKCELTGKTFEVWFNDEEQARREAPQLKATLQSTMPSSEVQLRIAQLEWLMKAK